MLEGKIGAEVDALEFIPGTSLVPQVSGRVVGAARVRSAINVEIDRDIGPSAIVGTITPDEQR